MTKRSRTKRTKRIRRSRLAKRTKRSRTKRTKRSSRLTKQTGGDLTNAIRLGGAILEHLVPIKITYGTTLLERNQDLTGKAMLYKQKPTINYIPHKEKTYLITMTDPDAPNAVGPNAVGPNARQTWTHYVVLITNNSIEEFYPYKPPTPPPNSGVHRYIFKAYPYNGEKIHKNLSVNNSMAGNVYYKQVLEPIIKKKDPMTTFQFTVKS